MKLSYLPNQLLKHPRLILLVFAGITIFLAYSVTARLFVPDQGLLIDTSLDNYISQNSRAYQLFNESRRVFGNEQFVVLAVQPPQKKMDLNFMLRLEQLTLDLEQKIPQLLKVQSLINIPRMTGDCAGKSWFHQKNLGDYCDSLLTKYQQGLDCLQNKSSTQSGIVEPASLDLFMEDPLDTPPTPTSNRFCSPDVLEKSADILYQETASGVDQIIAEMKGNSLIVKDLMSSSADTAGILLVFHENASVDSAQIQGELSKQIQILKDEGFTASYAGQSRQQYETSKTLRNDLRKILPVSLLVMIMILAFSFRSIRGVLIPLGIVISGTVWTAGIFALTGNVLNPLTMVLPPLIISVGSAYIIFVLHQYYELSASIQEPQLLIKTLFKKIGLPLLVTALTTVAGFAALGTSPVPAIKIMGLYASIGVVIIILLSLTVVPALLTLLPVVLLKKESHNLAILEPVIQHFSVWVGKYPRFFITVWLLIGIVSIAGLFQVKIDSSTSAFPENTPVMQDLRFIEQHLAGTNTLRILFEKKQEESKLQSADLMRKLDKFQQWLLENFSEQSLQPLAGLQVDKIYSVVDLIKYRFPDLEQLTDGEVEYFFDFLKRQNGPVYLSPDHKLLQITLRLRSEGSSAYLQLRDRLEPEVRQRFPDLEVVFTGSEVLASESVNQIAESQVSSVILALVIIFVILSILFMDPKMGLVALYPNVVSIAVFFGFLGWMSISIGVTISVIAAIALGIGVDDTIHFLSHYNSNVKLLRNKRKASEQAILQIGRPATLTTVSLSMGFLVFVSSDMQTQVLFGFLVAFTLGVCLLADLHFLPAIMVNTRLITVWDYAELKYTPEFLSKIPVFQGLTVRETKIATLMGYPIDMKPGETLFREGDIGNELLIILEGTIEIFWEKEFHQQEKVLATLTQGDSFGEMGLFRSTRRAATVRAVQNTKLLALTKEVLLHLKSRYPAIASKLFLNLSSKLYQAIQNADQQVIGRTHSAKGLSEFLQNVNPTDEELKKLVDNIIHEAIITQKARQTLEKHIYADNIVSAMEKFHLDRLQQAIDSGQVLEERSDLSDIFDTVSKRDYRWLESRFEIKEMTIDQSVAQEDSLRNYMVLILEGKLGIVQYEEGQTIPLRTVFQGDVLGEEIWVFGEKTWKDDVLVLEDVKLLLIDRQGFEDIAEYKQKLATKLSYNLVSMLSNRLQEMNYKLFHKSVR
ncbi:MAG: MMPL family transporter [SAR324 cluster bacterium]|nr:MMPL family transporter [SAR324 cluster bacterium]